MKVTNLTQKQRDQLIDGLLKVIYEVPDDYIFDLALYVHGNKSDYPENQEPPEWLDNFMDPERNKLHEAMMKELGLNE